MPIYENGPVKIHYEEAGTGFPLLVIPGGGLNAIIDYLSVANSKIMRKPGAEKVHSNAVATNSRKYLRVAYGAHR